jgi:hypothetical protein
MHGELNKDMRNSTPTWRTPQRYFRVVATRAYISCIHVSEGRKFETVSTPQYCIPMSKALLTFAYARQLYYVINLRLANQGCLDQKHTRLLIRLNWSGHSIA